MLSLLALTLVAVPAREIVTVQQVLATNVIIVATSTEKKLYINLFGVGTPETPDPNKHEHLLGKPDPCWTYTYLPSGTQVEMERCGTNYKGRVLARLFRIPDGLCWNDWLVERGGGFALVAELVGYEVAAREAHIGIWASLPRTQPEPDESPRPAITIQHFDPSHFSTPVKRFPPNDAEEDYYTYGMSPSNSGTSGGGLTAFGSGSKAGGVGAFGTGTNDGGFIAFGSGTSGVGGSTIGSGANGFGRDSYVNGYTRRDGTHVQSHHRTVADSSRSNNYSSKGNTNPFTGKPGYSGAGHSGHAGGGHR